MTVARCGASVDHCGDIIGGDRRIKDGRSVQRGLDEGDATTTQRSRATDELLILK